MSYAPPPPPPPGEPGYGYAAPKNNQKAVWSLVLGIAGLICCGLFTGIPAAILGNMAKKEIAASGGTQTGAGMAQAGFILGLIAIVLGVIGLILVATGAISTNFSTSP